VSRIAIRVEGLGKRYRTGAAPAAGLREALARALRSPFPPAEDPDAGHLWALRGASFEVAQGEVVGIVGANGSGKSTLLKILARVTAPTEGRMAVRGRVGGLLEAGTGFHPDLTGRENVFVSGAILGMKRREIAGKLDAIAGFAGLGDFLEAPVRQYSSGMWVRLAFAVGAHLDARILLVDEVLGAGDAEFQRRCFDKVRELTEAGRAVVLVSHDLQTVARLCGRALWIHRGRLEADAPSAEAIERYLAAGTERSCARSWADPQAAPGDAVVRLTGVRVRAEDGSAVPAFDLRRAVAIELEWTVSEPGHVLLPRLQLVNRIGRPVFTAVETGVPGGDRPRPPGRHRSVAWIPGDLLAEGPYTVDVALGPPEGSPDRVSVREAVGFRVAEPVEGGGARGRYRGVFPGAVRPLLRWEASHEGEPAR